MISRFGNLDYERGSLRLLLTLYRSEEELNRDALMGKLHDVGVGKSAFYSSLAACSELGLIEDTRKQVANISYTISNLTSKGRLVAEKLLEIKRILEK